MQRLKNEGPTTKTMLYIHLELLNDLMTLFLQRRKISVSAVRSVVPQIGLVDLFKGKLLYITMNASTLFRRILLSAGVNNIDIHVETLKEEVRNARNKICHFEWVNPMYVGDQMLHDAIFDFQHFIIVELCHHPH